MATDVVDGLGVSVFSVPTDGPEADGTLEWSTTTLVLVEVTGAGERSLGYTYSSPACKPLIDGLLADVVLGRPVLDVGGTTEAMSRAVRNVGRPGLVACAISAIDTALWGLKAALLGVPVAGLLGRVHDAVPVYGSGGFTTYDEPTARQQLEQWVDLWQIPRVKIKIGESWGRRTDRDLDRVVFARRVIGPSTELYVDANGAYTRKQAIRLARQMADFDVSWFEEPVSSDDLDGLHEVREQVAADVAAGEYGYELTYFARMVAAQAVDCLQVDVTRCGGFTTWLRVAALAAAHGLQVSAHCAPSLHVPVAAAVPNLRHIELFHDHVRVEHLLFEGTGEPAGGVLRPDPTRPGIGLDVKRADAERFRVA